MVNTKRLYTVGDQQIVLIYNLILLA